MAPPFDSATGARRNLSICVKAVAGVLGNTAAVCRKAYIHPGVIAAYEAGELPLRASGDGRAFELAVLRFLEAAKA